MVVLISSFFKLTIMLFEEGLLGKVMNRYIIL